MTTSPRQASTVQVRARVRPALTDAVTAPQPSEDNVALLNKQLDLLVSGVAVANSLKNKGTRDEKKAKTSLEETMNANGLKSHETLVEFPDKSRLVYVAEIAPGIAQSIDMKALAQRMNLKIGGKKEDIEMFFSMITTSFKAVEDNLGANICAQLKVSKPTLPALSVSQKKD